MAGDITPEQLAAHLRGQAAHMGSGYFGGVDIDRVDPRAEYRVGNGRGAYVDLVADQEVGGMNKGMRTGLGPLVFWALLSLSAVVANSWGQTPMATQTPSVSAAPPKTIVWPSPVQRVMPGSIPAQAMGPQTVAPVVSSPVPTVLPKNYVPGPAPGGH